MADTLTPAEWKALLDKMEPTGKPWIILGLADAMPTIVERYEVNTKDRQSRFLATVAHESDHFRATVEYASGAAYEGRRDLGNTHKGDGRKYKGRGLIQLTGRSNYRAASDEFTTDFVADPDLVGVFPWAALVSAWWWKNHDLNRIADRGDPRAICKVVNGGYNGIDSRIALTKIAERCLA
jgi:putative chitinase